MNIKIIALTIIAAVSLALDFIPVKYAKKDAYTIIDGQEYVFCYEPKTNGSNIVDWVAYGYNDEIDYDITPLQASVIGKNPYDCFTKRDFEPIKLYNRAAPDDSNKYILYGDIQKVIGSDEQISELIIDVKDWDIIYPVNRLSIRRHYVPKNYLTVYDYNWINVIRAHFE